MKLPVVDEHDVEIGIKERNELGVNDIYRVSALWVSNSKNQYLLSQRALTKKHSPGKWGPAVAGTVEVEETYEINLLKEIQEELGILLPIDRLRLGPKTKRTPPNSSAYFTQWYFANVDMDVSEFTFPEDEVMGLRWLTEEELKTALATNPEEFLPAIHESIEILIKGSKVN